MTLFIQTNNTNQTTKQFKKNTNIMEKQFITIEQAKKEGNNNTNQSIKDQFIQRHVYANVNSLVEYIIQKGFEDSNAPFTIDDIENMYIEDEETGESEMQEVFSWFIVSEFLAEKLKEKNEPIINNENIWGRGTFGQAISLDYVITEICAEIEILENQEYSWENRK
jgi:hypothetical protein